MGDDRNMFRVAKTAAHSMEAEPVQISQAFFAIRICNIGGYLLYTSHQRKLQSQQGAVQPGTAASLSSTLFFL